MNMNSQFSSEDPLRDQIQMDVRAIEPDLTPEEITEQQLAREESARDSAGDEIPMDVDGSGGEQPYDGYEGNWPGDGSGMDDFADYNANEADDYRDE